MTTSLSRPLRALNLITVLSIVFGLLFSYAGATSSLSDDVNLTLNPRLGRSVRTRAVQSSATCLSQFDWMDNSLGQSPCITVAYLLSACSSGNWHVPTLPNASFHYSVPVEIANGCQCSWAAYNTYQACSLCQGTDFASAMRTWSGYNLNCSGHLSDPDYYPRDTPIPAETAIPFWATTDPSTWHNGKFDPTMAQSIKNEGLSDITENSRSESQNKKSSNTGAIVGGVIGGLLGLAALALIFFFLRRRHRYTRLKQQQSQNQGATNLKHRPTFSTVRFSPSLLTHWRTGSSGTTATAATLAGQPMGGKVAGQTAASYMYGSGAGGGILTTPSPGPTIPVSMTGSTNGGGRPPLNSNSSSSYTSGPTMTNTPPLGGGQEYVTRPAGKNYAYGIPQPIPAGQGGGGYLTAMNLNHSNSTSNLATIAPSSASTTAGGASAIARNSHAHTLSNDSVGLSAGPQYGGEPPEGTVVPFILPPTLPEPMGGESGAGPGAGGGVTSVQSASSKGGHGRGPSDSSNVTSNALVRTSTPDIFTTAFNPARPPPERRNPPAYTPTSPPPPPGIDDRTSMEEYGGTDGGGGADGDGDAFSVEAQRGETTLSGTTLRGQGTSSGRAPTTLGDDAVHNRPGGDRDGARGERGEGLREERGRFGYPVDRKV